MHYLCKILAMPDELGIDLSGDESKEEQIVNIRREVLYALDESTTAFDWRTDDAGRWDESYPNNVIIGKYAPETLISEVKKIVDIQNKSVAEAIEIAKNSNIVNLTDLWSWIIQTPYNDNNLWETSLAIEHLKDYLGGNFNHTTHVLDLTTGSSVITNETLSEVVEFPEKFVLVLVDCHF